MLTYEETVIDLLRFALRKRQVSSNWYVLYNQEVNPLPGGMGESGFGLVKKGDKWLVYNYDRAIRSDFSLHDKISDAANDLFWKLTDPPTMYDFREEWEAKTGNVLNPFE